MWKLIGYYTDKYKQEMDGMVASARSVCIEPKITHLDDRGGWEENCNFVSELILSELENDDKDVVYVDADARFTKYPVLFDNIDGDVAFHRLIHRRFDELLGGTLYFKNNDTSKKLAREWVAECHKQKKEWTQRNLDAVLSRIEGLKVTILPVEYCAIFDHPNAQGKDNIIVHYQASRRLKR